jgi:hypothetical protein
VVASHDAVGKEVRMTTIITFAVFGAVTGALTAAILLLLDFKENSLYIVPGLVFGIAFALALWQRWRLPPARAVAYVIAVGLANAAAVFVTLYIADEVAKIVVGKEAGDAVTGVIAGALGAGLATGATALLIRIRRWPWPVAVGAILGGLLPVFIDGPDGGIFLFYIVWQCGFAAATVATLPPLERA